MVKKFRWVFLFAALTVLTVPLWIIPACQLLFGSSSDESSEPVSLPEPSGEATQAGSWTSAFGVDLFVESRKGSEARNFVVSPGSAFFALVLAREGASGNSLAELTRVLRVQADDPAKADQCIRRLHSTLASRRDAEVVISNATWIRDGFTPKAEFLASLQDNYGARVFSGGFGPGSASEMNRWVSDATKGRITSMRAPLATDVLVLANAAYFKGAWLVKFDPGITAPRDFHRPDGSKALVPFMHSVARDRLVYREEDSVIIDLPFKHGGFSFRAAMAEDGAGLEALVKKLTGGALRPVWTGEKHVRWLKADLAMPRFVMRSQVDLAPVVSALGAASIFDSRTAEFERMKQAGDSTPLFMSAIDQESFVEVNEDGAEAVTVTRSSFGCSKVENIAPDSPVVLDRPFVYAIVDRISGAILFMGHVTDPSK